MVYARLRRHFQFVNELGLFAEVHSRATYSINIYGPILSQPGFDTLANLFVPNTIEACYSHDGSSFTEGIKGSRGQRNTAGHRDRIVWVDEMALATFARLYDEPGTPARYARLPALHAGALNSVLQKLAAYPRRLAELGDDYFSTVMFDETYSQRDGTLVRRPTSDAGFPASPEDWVLSGPHFFVATPYMKTPRKVCTEKGHYDVLGLETLPDDYLPRTNYRPMVDRAEYLRRTPRACWVEEGEAQGRAVTEFFRYVNRRRMNSNNERTAIGTVVPPGVAHIDGCFSIAFQSQNDLISFASSLSSLPFDFLLTFQ